MLTQFITQYWTGDFFDNIYLKSLGVQMFLSHSGEPCAIPGNIIEDFVIMDTNGIHLVNMQFCGCYEVAGGAHNCVQLLRAGLLPLHTSDP
jgi:hypothetical protein